MTRNIPNAEKNTENKESGTEKTRGPQVSDHELLRCIGSGSYGEVWLARSVMGTYRAAKVVYREKFDNDHPFEREWLGIQKFEPISRTHPGLVSILHIGRPQPGYFYYVMEIADDVNLGADIDSERYSARTLSRELERRGRLPVEECVRLGLWLTASLGYLHHQRLLHRDIKPSNIIFVKDQAKIADIGLVIDVGKETAPAGTPGYIPKHGRGTPSADLYSLGKVLYEMSTGKDRLDYPVLPTDIDTGGNLMAMRQLNEIILKACDDSGPLAGFHSARELFDELSRIDISSHGEKHSEENWFRALWSESGPPAPLEQPRLEAIGGAVPIDSAFYIERSGDREFEAAVVRSDSTILVKGARQMGKTSLLARGLQQAREQGAQVILTDFQELNDSDLESLKSFYIALANEIADQLELEELLPESWDERRSPNHNFERYFRWTLLSRVPIHLFWGLDEVDRLFTTNFGGQVFGMFRAWHNRRALEPGGPWSKLTLAIAYATEAHLFITDLNQSPFNVGTRITLDDLTLDQVAELNQRYGDPLRDQKELKRFVAFLGGQPYLSRRGFHELVTRNLSYEVFETMADREEGIFGDHLRRILLSLRKDMELIQAMKSVLTGQPCPADSFYRLRSAGVLTGDTAREAKPRCQLYANCLKRYLL